MKQLKSSLADLRRLFAHSLTLRDIAEPLVSFDSDHRAGELSQFMLLNNFDVVGVRRDGIVVGYVERKHLGSGSAGDTLVRLKGDDMKPDSASMAIALEYLRDHPAVFVAVMGQVWGIVTSGDLQKAPFRMWLFGLISLTEMQMLRLIREQFPGDSWMKLLNENRLSAAEKLYIPRKRSNQEIDLADCLQLCDKRTIFSKSPTLWPLFGEESRTLADNFFDDLENLRNDLAHANDIIHGRWPALIDLVAKCESLLERLEAFPREGASKTGE